MTGVAPQYADYAPLGLGVVHANPKKHPTPGELLVERQPLILGQLASGHRADGPDPAGGD